MKLANDLQNIPLAGIAHRCRKESQRFFQNLPNDTRYCYELFRRAIVEQSEQAWELLYIQYQSLVHGWIKKHRNLLTSSEEVASFINEVFAKFALAMDTEKFESSSNLKSVLCYFEMCANSVMVDHQRGANRLSEVDQEPVNPDFVETLLDDLVRQELWKQIERHLQSDAEKQLMVSLYGLGMKPSEVCKKWPEQFPDIKRTQQIHQNILARLRRDGAIWRLYKGDHPDE